MTTTATTPAALTLVETYELREAPLDDDHDRCAECGADMTVHAWRRTVAFRPDAWVCEPCGWDARRAGGAGPRRAGICDEALSGSC
ncbi:MAG: hypothetical protein ACAI43_03240 [Phycisphaerae bacterium]